MKLNNREILLPNMRSLYIDALSMLFYGMFGWRRDMLYAKELSSQPLDLTMGLSFF